MKKKEASTTGDGDGDGDGITEEHDQISSLPDEILHDILERLRSPKQAAKAALLSKTWSHLWLSYPVLEFDYYTDYTNIGPSRSTMDSFIAAAMRKLSSSGLSYIKSVRIVSRIEVCNHANLKHLRISKSWMTVGESQIVVGALRSLETLSLSSLPCRDLEVIYSSILPSLKSLEIKHCHNLRSYGVHKLISKSPSLLSLHLANGSIEDDSPTPVVERVEVKPHGKMEQTFIYNMLWSCHPKYVSVCRDAYAKESHHRQLSSLKLINQVFMERASPNCKTVACKCWRHQLKDLKIVNTNDKKEEELMDVSDDVLSTLQSENRVLFRLTWH
ncbi:Putative FBD-associated F-box protein At5g56690 [Linum perenne]